jgi:hypothetical protein
MKLGMPRLARYFGEFGTSGRPLPIPESVLKGFADGQRKVRVGAIVVKTNIDGATKGLATSGVVVQGLRQVTDSLT